MKDGTKFRRFLVIDILQLILVEPDTKRLGWGVAKLVGFLQDVEVAGDKDDSRCLHLTIHRGGASNANRTPILSAKFMFDDHIRCMAAKQRLTKGRSKARQKKMYQIAQLLDVPGGQAAGEGALPNYSANILRGSPASVGRVPREHRPLFSTANRCPGVASALRRDSSSGSVVSRVQMQSNHRLGESDSVNQRRRMGNNYSQNGRRESSPVAVGTPVSSKSSREGSRNRTSTPRSSRESSPRIIRPRSEEIPLENFCRSQNNSPVSRCSTNNTPSRTSRSSTPIRISSVGVSSMLETIPANVSLASTSSPQVDASAVPCEETSFIGDGKNKKKGGIETV
jgi:protein CLEC16A